MGENKWKTEKEWTKEKERKKDRKKESMKERKKERSKLLEADCHLLFVKEQATYKCCIWD
jgi:hypothetical protein